MKRLRRVRDAFIAAAVVVWLWHIVAQALEWVWWADPGYGLIVILACEAAYGHGKLSAHHADAMLIVEGKLPEVSYVERDDR